MQDTPPASESSSFRGPKPQDLVKLRKAMESGDLDLVKSVVWSNPRYLIGSGDTPVILQVMGVLYGTETQCFVEKSLEALACISN